MHPEIIVMINASNTAEAKVFIQELIVAPPVVGRTVATGHLA
jgi:hypothetical protein